MFSDLWQAQRQLAEIARREGEEKRNAILDAMNLEKFNDIIDGIGDPVDEPEYSAFKVWLEGRSALEVELMEDPDSCMVLYGDWKASNEFARFTANNELAKRLKQERQQKEKRHRGQSSYTMRLLKEQQAAQEAAANK